MHVESLEAGHEQPGMKRPFLKSLSKKRARFLFDSVFFFFFFRTCSRCLYDRANFSSNVNKKFFKKYN